MSCRWMNSESRNRLRAYAITMNKSNNKGKKRWDKKQKQLFK